jgi:NAD+ synthase (glutamine-hydrolysing)
MYSICRIAAVSPELKIADPFYNIKMMEKDYLAAVKNGASLVVFPAMAVTGKSCGVLFKQPYLLKSALAAAEMFASVTTETAAVFGLPLMINGKLFECAAIAQNGRITAFTVNNTPDIAGFCTETPAQENFYPAGTVFEGNFTFSVNFSTRDQADSGAQAELFLLAEAEVPGMWQRRKNFALSRSAESGCAVFIASAGCGESTTDQLYGGALIGACSGIITASRPSPAAEAGMIFSDIDLEKIDFARLNKPFFSAATVKIDAMPEAMDLKYLYNPKHPFLPENAEEFCKESFALQCIGLYQRFKRCGAKKFVLGISGGLDSTLALAVLAMVCRENKLSPDTILAVTMPGFGTTNRTKNNALRLAEVIGAEIKEISIDEACRQHFADLEHDINVTNSVYENAQARERTQILMDLANKVNGIVIGTGDLSEIALGWSTFNGDQMAMYAVNSSIPKTNIAPMLMYAAKVLNGTEEILQDVIDTPVSPELLPLDENGEIAQKTEAILGAYELHDYYLYQLTSGVSAPEKLFALARDAFKGEYPDEELIRVRDLFMRRFFTQQFKRTAAPDGIQAGVVSLSARTAWQMPADASGTLWRK